MSHGKKYRDARSQVDRERTYSPVEALGMIKGFESAKFDETVEAHFRLGLNVRHAEQQLRGTLMLPHGTGKEVRVAVFAEGEKAKEAETAGADVVGAADLATKIEGGFDDFDVAIATPDMMGVVGKLGRILGPRGKMPNPKTGTVTFDIAQGRRRREGRQARVPHGPRRERPSLDRQEELRPAAARRELRRRHRRDRSGEARRREGPLHRDDHRHDDHGPGHPRRSRRRHAASSRSWRTLQLAADTDFDRRRPLAAHDRAEAQPR